MIAFFHAIVSGKNRGLGPKLFRAGLGLAAIPYRWGVDLRHHAYDRSWLTTERVQVPVVSVGNLTLGGTGKTPCVEYIAKHYRTLGRRVTILSRGYGSTRGRNDEALVLEKNVPDVPHLQGAKRTALARRAVAELRSEVLVLDDGFQHRSLGRDLDLVLIDAMNPWGYGHLFPRGLLREKPGNLRRAGMVLLTRCDQVDDRQRKRLKADVNRFAPGIAVAETIHRPLEWVNRDQLRVPLHEYRGRPAAVFCGIGNPEAFRRTLLDLGIRISAFRGFPDHHRYEEKDLEALEKWAAEQSTDSILLTTQKDLVKLEATEIGGRPLWALRIDIGFLSGQELLDDKLNELVNESAQRPWTGQLKAS